MSNSEKVNSTSIIEAYNRIHNYITLTPIHTSHLINSGLATSIKKNVNIIVNSMAKNKTMNILSYFYFPLSYINICVN